MKKNIVIIDGHPDHKSFCAAMVQEYIKGAQESDCSVETIVVRDLEFDPILHYGYRKIQELEADLLKAQDTIRDSEHIVVILPVWWGNVPALFKGFLDRCFIAGFSHRFDPVKKRPEKLLKGRSLSVIYTQGSPWWYSKYFLNDAFWKTLKRGVFGFAGFCPVKRKYYSTVKSGDDAERTRILKDVYHLGKKQF